MSSPVSGAGPWDPVRGDVSRHDGDTTGSGHSGDSGDSPTLTMTLPPLLLHAGSVTSTAGPAPAPPLALGHRIHQDSTPSPAKLTSPCPLCSGNCSKVSALQYFKAFLNLFLYFSFTARSASSEETSSTRAPRCVRGSQRSSCGSSPCRETSPTARRR